MEHIRNVVKRGRKINYDFTEPSLWEGACSDFGITQIQVGNSNNSCQYLHGKIELVRPGKMDIKEAINFAKLGKAILFTGAAFLRS